MSNRKFSDTSNAAYKELHPNMVSNHHGKILSAMRLLGVPVSMEGISDKAGLTYEQSHKRFSELEREGLIKKEGKGKTKAGRACWLYSLVKQADVSRETINKEILEMDTQEFFTRYQNGEFDEKEPKSLTQPSLFD